MKAIEQFDGAAGLIRLQVPDQMPARRSPANVRNFGLGFLYAILAKIIQPGGNRLAYCFGGVRLANRHQGDFINRPIASVCCCD